MTSLVLTLYRLLVNTSSTVISLNFIPTTWDYCSQRFSEVSEFYHFKSRKPIIESVPAPHFALKVNLNVASYLLIVTVGRAVNLF